ncbi:MAG: (2Fe-2S) ferredoxin domain-containing protein, partial [Firmicutes bacterium]|nr:(2Fe-2S) ferredoxin domain-containing protein [Bacillota bacterium]
MKGSGNLHFASRRVLICTGTACRNRGSRELMKHAKRATKESDVAVVATACLRLCTRAPNVVIYPQGVWFGGVSRATIGQVVDSEAPQNPALQPLIT